MIYEINGKMSEFYEVKAYGLKEKDGNFQVTSFAVLVLLNCMTPCSIYLQPITIRRGITTDNDVEMDIKYCGVCHSDLHVAKNDFGSTKYPFVPGHELAGYVTKVKHIFCAPF